MQEGRSAAQIAEDKERFLDGLIFISREEDVVEAETNPMDERAERPDQIEEQDEKQSFAGEAGGGVFGGEERTIESTPEKVEVVFHLGRISLHEMRTFKKAGQAF